MADPVQPSNNIVNGNADGNAEPAVSNTGDQSVNAKGNRTSEVEEHVRFWPLFKALRKKDWKGVEDLISKDPQALTYIFQKSSDRGSVFHLLAGNLSVPVCLLEKLVSEVDKEGLEQLTDKNGQTPIFSAAWFGNTKAARVFVRRNKDSPNKRSGGGALAIHCAAEAGHKDTIQYLLKVTRERLDDRRAVHMLKNLINAGYYDIAFDLLKRYPKLAREHNQDRKTILEMLACRPLAFQSGSRLGYWKRLIYKWISVRDEHIYDPEIVNGDMKDPVETSKKLNKFAYFGSILQQAFGTLYAKMHIMPSNALILLGPGIKYLRNTKLKHKQALEIVRMMCHDGVVWSREEALNTLWAPWLTAARFGIYEIIDEILNAYYNSYAFNYSSTKHYIFHIGILHRQEKVISLLNRQNIFMWNWKTPEKIGEKSENILHLTGYFVHSSQVSGAALQVQRELQWFKAVESYVYPSHQEQQNKDKKTPREVFTDQHKDLVKEGEKWMKDTAQSCTVVAALIITVVFAAAFTVPGGNNTEGLPTFLQKPPFIVFVIADTLALFSSISSVIMFLGILTSRYSEDDFLEALPKKLIIGLITLFFSIASMTVAFGATIYVVLSQTWKWVIIPIALLGCLPAILYGWLQFPLLVEIYSSTYRSSIFQAFQINKDKMTDQYIMEEAKLQSDEEICKEFIGKKCGFIENLVCCPRSSNPERLFEHKELLERVNHQEQIIKEQQKAIENMQKSYAELVTHR